MDNTTVARPSNKLEDPRGKQFASPQKGESKGDDGVFAPPHGGYQRIGNWPNLRGGHREGPPTSTAGQRQSPSQSPPNLTS